MTQSEEFHRIKRPPPYVFAEVDRLKPVEDGIPGARNGHHRLRYGQSGYGYDGPYCRETGRASAKAADPTLDGPQDCVAEIRGVCEARRNVLVQAMGRAGWDIPAPPATMFAWAPVPEPFTRCGSMEFSKLLLREAEVAVSPGVGFGEYGEGYMRICRVENEQRIRQAVRGIRRLMQRANEILGRFSQLRGQDA